MLAHSDLAPMHTGREGVTNFAKFESVANTVKSQVIFVLVHSDLVLRHSGWEGVNNLGKKGSGKWQSLCICKI